MLDTDHVLGHESRARQLVATGRRAEAVHQLRQAIALWRGPVFGGLRNRFLQPVVVEWQERRLGLIEDCLELELELGRHQQVIGELSAIVAEAPLRERPRAQLMTALYRAGRRPEALEVYHDLRTALREELGLEPSEELRELHRAILRDTVEASGAEKTTASAALVPGRSAARTPPALPLPAMLPPDLPDFTGRPEQVGTVRRAIDAAEPRPVVITGPGGAGKSALAVHVAHAVRERFPDGQLYINLRGTGEHPVSPADALAWLLAMLGVEDLRLPGDPDQRAGLYRTLLARRRVLVVVDDADSEAQVLPLLPGVGASAVIVTSRSRLTGLAGTRQLELGGFTPAEAVELLARVVGSQRVRAEAETAGEIVRWCGLLPIAVRIAGARLAARPHWPLARLAGHLADESRRLDALEQGESGVRGRLSPAYRQLPTDARRLLRMLGRVGSSDIRSWLGAPLLAVDEQVADDAFEALVEARLLEVTGIDAGGVARYHLPDLARLYAMELAEADPDPVGLTRPLSEAAWTAAAHGHYGFALAQLESVLRTVLQADDPAFEALINRRIGQLHLELGYPTRAERHLVGAERIERGIDGEPRIHTVFQFGKLHQQRGELALAREAFEEVLAFGEQRDHRMARAWALTGLGRVYLDLGQRSMAALTLWRANGHAHDIGDELLQLQVRHSFGALAQSHSRHRAAATILRVGVGLCRRRDTPLWLARYLHRLGTAAAHSGEADTAVAPLREALDIFTELGSVESASVAADLAEHDGSGPAAGDISTTSGQHGSDGGRS